MQLHYLLVVVVVSDVTDVKAMSSTVAVIFTITWVVNNYNIITIISEPNWVFWIRTEPNSFRTESEFFFKKWNQKQTEIKKSILQIPNAQCVQNLAVCITYKFKQWTNSTDTSCTTWTDSLLMWCVVPEAESG